MTSTQPYFPGFESEQRKRDLSQWYTPAWLSMRLWRWAEPRPTDRVLEPAAGRGALLAPMLGKGKRELVAYEIDPGNVDALRMLMVNAHAQNGWSFEVRAADFTADPDVLQERFDLCVMNPPYEDGQDCAFVERALICCERVVGVFRLAMVASQERAGFWERVRPMRIAFLSSRPQFGQSERADGARSDFVVMELARSGATMKRAAARPVPLATRATVEWW